ncbi:MAG: peptidoglycan D,D-transpeptidase FtsI family protein [Tepidiformaceae bacterium]
MALQRASGTRRVWLPATVMGLFALAVFARLIQLQVIEHERYAAAADAELSASNTIYARRGTILDRNGNVLAASVDTWDIYVSARTWRDDAEAQVASGAIGAALGLDPAELRQRVSEAGTIDVLVARDVEYEVGNELSAARLPGVSFASNTARVNPEGDTGASILGFIGLDNTGLAGVEAAWNEVLQGKVGKAIYERDTTGERIPFGDHVAIAPEPGSDLVLTIDRHLQRLCEEYLRAAIEKHDAKKGGTILMMDPATGEILCLATAPALKFSELDDLDLGDEEDLALLKNRAITDTYEPGSVMKVVTAAAAIDRGVVSPGTTYVDNGVVNVAGIQIRNWRFEHYGTQTMTGVLQHSINTGAVYMAQLLGAEAFHEYLEAFGFGRTTGIDLMGEAGGIVRQPDDKDWSPVDLAAQSFGQSISVTPLQMTSAVAAIINGGNLIRPHVVKAVVEPDGQRRDVRPRVVGRAISEETSDTLRQMMNEVVDPDGRTYPGNPSLYTAGGKSGTANIPIYETGGYNDQQIASFIGFAPLDDPEIVVLVMLDDNRDGATGTEAAAPVFARLTDETLGYLGLAPDAARYLAAGGR